MDQKVLREKGSKKGTLSTHSHLGKGKEPEEPLKDSDE